MWQEGGTLVIPGHGRICDEADVVEYRDMVTIIRDVDSGSDREGQNARADRRSNPAGDYKTRYGSDTGAWTTNMFVEAVYRSLTIRNNREGGTERTKHEQNDSQMIRRRLFAASAAFVDPP